MDGLYLPEVVFYVKDVSFSINDRSTNSQTEEECQQIWSGDESCVEEKKIQKEEHRKWMRGMK